MAKRKKPESESFDEARVRQLFELIANKSTRSEKMSWDRKMDNMITLMSKIKPIEEQILVLLAKKTPIIDEIQVLRTDMVAECIHPFEYLVYKQDHIVCKFCFRKISLPKVCV